MSAKRKREAVPRLPRGEDLEPASSDPGATTAGPGARRDDFPAAGEASPKSRPADHRDRELRAGRDKNCELTLANDLLEGKIDRIRAGLPFSRRRSRP